MCAYYRHLAGWTVDLEGDVALSHTWSLWKNSGGAILQSATTPKITNIRPMGNVPLP